MSIIKVTLSRASKDYDLANKDDKKQFKRLTTEAINNNRVIRLYEIKHQLEALSVKNVVEEKQLVRINAKLIPGKGENRFQKLYAYLLTDMAQYTSDISYLIEYSALVVNMFIHVATFTPHQGHGQAQLREFNQKSHMQYYRSQSNHPNAAFFRALTNTSDKSTSRLPFNEGFIKLIAGDDFSPDFCAEIKKIDPKTGLAKPGQNVNPYVMTKIAHAGARKNNLATLIQGMNAIFEGKSLPLDPKHLENTLTTILPSTKTINKLSIDECANRINALYKHFNKLRHNHSPKEQLSGRMLAYRIKRIERIQQLTQALGLRHIRLESQHQNITCLMIRLYPNCFITDDTYKEGVTNVLLSFFGGLLNHMCEKKELHLYTTRRQSFGFLRPTITDAGCLTIRLSLGLEPTSFDTVIIDCLQQFDALLDTFRFDDKTHARVSMVFELIAPLKEKKPRSRAGDTYIRNAVRKDEKTLLTFQQAKAYIDQYASLEQAMSDFLRYYICQNQLLSPKNSLHQPSISTVQRVDSPTIDLLKNTLIHICDAIQALATQANNKLPIYFPHISLHVVSKLFKHAFKAQQLLTDYERMEASEFYYQALLTVDNCLEYLILLHGLEYIETKLQGQPRDHVTNLRDSELHYIQHCLKITRNQLNVFFTDSGQQAITTTLLTLSIILHGAGADGKSYDSDIYLFGDSYFEIAEFINDCHQDKLTLKSKHLYQAKIVFVDVSQINPFFDKFTSGECRAMKALVIDMTHHPLLDDNQLQDQIKTLHQAGIWVVLVESSLKHAQLGLDKYQSGKITTIAPPGKALPNAAMDIFEQVSRDAIHPLTASYLWMVNRICQDKQPLALGAFDNSDLNVPRLVRGIQYVTTQCNELVHESRSLDPANKPRDVGAQNVNCQQALVAEEPATMVSSRDKVSTMALLQRGFSLIQLLDQNPTDESNVGQTLAQHGL